MIPIQSKNKLVKINKILVLRFRRVGDSVLSSALCTSLRKTFPDAKIDYVLNDEIAPLFENHPDIDRIIMFRREEMKGWKTYLKKVRLIMRSGRYDLIVDTRSTVKTLWFSLVSLSTPYRIGKKKPYNWFLHNYRVHIDFDGEGDEVSSTLRLLSPLDKEFKVYYDPGFKLYVTPEEKEFFRCIMVNCGINFSKPILVCAVTTRLLHKTWNKEWMKQILQRMIEQYDVQLIFNYGGIEEKKSALALHQEMGYHPRIFTNIEARDLRQLAAMLENSDFFFGNEGGPRHISQALNVPSFAIYPPNISKKQWLPNASGAFQGIEPADVSREAMNNDLSYSEKFDLITVEVVWEKLDAMLKKFLPQL
jgi:heptosyltransferase-2